MLSTLSPDAMRQHYKTMMRLLTEGRVIPFLGAGANLCGRPLQHHDLDLGVERGEPGLDCRLQILQLCPSDHPLIRRKKGGPGPTFSKVRVR